MMLCTPFILFNVNPTRWYFLALLGLLSALSFILIKCSLGLPYELSIPLILHYSISLITLFLATNYVGRSLEKKRREEFKLLRQISAQYEKSQAIFGNLLPNFIKDKVKQGLRYIVEEKSLVTILFCDIYNFDSICVTHTSNELIELLGKFFSKLDRLCNQHGVTKIETVNKTYMLCGGLEDIEATLDPELQEIPHAERCINIGISILECLQGVFLKTGEQLNVKIGIHSGPVIAGVVGDHKPQFSLVGDTVNTASRMCSTIKTAGEMQISMETHNLINMSKYRLVQSQVYAKGKGLLTTFYVKPSE